MKKPCSNLLEFANFLPGYSHIRLEFHTLVQCGIVDAHVVPVYIQGTYI